MSDKIYKTEDINTAEKFKAASLDWGGIQTDGTDFYANIRIAEQETAGGAVAIKNTEYAYLLDNPEEDYPDGIPADLWDKLDADDDLWEAIFDDYADRYEVSK